MSFYLHDMVHVNNKMQKQYWYVLTAKQGELRKDFTPVLNPGDMLRLGVFGGKYMTDCLDEYPEHMMHQARFSKLADAKINAFKVLSGDPLAFWNEKGWIHPQDPRGWFEWYCRYWIGRRSDDDDRQIERWKRFVPRHSGMLKLLGYGRLDIRAKTRQSLLHWAHDPVPDIPCLEGESVVSKIYRVLGKIRYGDAIYGN